MKNCRPFKKTLAFSVALCFFAVISWVVMPARIQAAAAGTQISAGSDDQPNYVVRERAARHYKKKPHSILPWIIGGAVVLTVALVLLLKKKSGSDGSVTVSKFGGHGTADGLFDYPNGIALDSSGNVYISEFNNRRIQKFTANGVFIKKWSFSPGLTPYGLVVYGNRLYVCDINNMISNLQVFDLDGNHLATWNVPDYNTSSGAPSAVDVDADSSGNLYVLDSLNREVVIFNGSGTVKGHYRIQRDNPWPGPFGIAIAGSQVYVTDADIQQYGNRVNVFDLSGNFVRTWGGAGSGPGQFYNPVGIAVMNGNSVIVGDHNLAPTGGRIQKFSFSGDYLGVIQPALGGFYPKHLAVNDKAGKIYICAASGDEILVVDTF